MSYLLDDKKMSRKVRAKIPLKAKFWLQKSRTNSHTLNRNETKNTACDWVETVVVNNAMDIEGVKAWFC